MHTAAAAKELAALLGEAGCETVVLTDLARSDMAKAVEDAFRYDRLVLATTTYNAGIFPFMREFIAELTERNFQKRTVGIIENGCWAPMAEKVIRRLFENSKELTFTENNVHIRSALSDENRAELAALAGELMQKR